MNPARCTMLVAALLLTTSTSYLLAWYSVITLRATFSELPRKKSTWTKDIFFKTFFEWTHDLIDNQSGVKGNFAVLFGAFEKFLAVGGFHQGDILDSYRAPG